MARKGNVGTVKTPCTPKNSEVLQASTALGHEAQRISAKTTAPVRVEQDLEHRHRTRAAISDPADEEVGAGEAPLHDRRRNLEKHDRDDRATCDLRRRP